MDTLLCTATPFGYGPAAKLLDLAGALAGRRRLLFVGRGSALELIRRSAPIFDNIIATDDVRGEIVRRGADVAAVLSVMDQEAGRGAADAGLPLYVVDSLLWMRPDVPEAFAGARHYLAQDFPGLDPQSYRLRPTVVGPILGHPTGEERGPRSGLVVNLGGSAAPDGRDPLYGNYARFVVRALTESGLLERHAGATLLGGSAALRAAGEVAPGDVERLGASRAEARRRMETAAVVLTAPGLTATLECFQARTPTWFLPPQNYSQWCILRALREAGVSGPAFHWQDLPGVEPVGDRLPRETRDPIVVDTITRKCGDPDAGRLLSRTLSRVGADSARQTDCQDGFFRSLGSSGLRAIEQVVTSGR